MFLRTRVLSFDLTRRVTSQGVSRACSGPWGGQRSEEHEDLLDVTFDVLDLLADDVEANGLGERAALANGRDVTDVDTEGG